MKAKHEHGTATALLASRFRTSSHVRSGQREKRTKRNKISLSRLFRMPELVPNRRARGDLWGITHVAVNLKLIFQFTSRLEQKQKQILRGKEMEIVVGGLFLV